MDGELEVLGIRPRKVINLEETFTDPYFEQKYILHFDARDVQRARKPPRVEQ
jgi:16S rRNA (guanine527-N7)-methyltransferase